MKKKLIIIGIVILVFCLIGLYVYNNDNMKFKLTYELANKYDYGNNRKIKVNIPINNRIKYLNSKSVVDLFKNKTGIVYFGYSTCPWCRNAIPILIDAVISNDIDTLYYVDINETKLTKELYEILDEYLRVDEDNKKVFSVPDVYVIKNGKVIDHHIGTVDSYNNPFKGMSKEEKKELKKIYTNMIKEIK